MRESAQTLCCRISGARLSLVCLSCLPRSPLCISLYCWALPVRPVLRFSGCSIGGIKVENKEAWEDMCRLIEEERPTLRIAWDSK